MGNLSQAAIKEQQLTTTGRGPAAGRPRAARWLRVARELAQRECARRRHFLPPTVHDLRP